MEAAKQTVAVELEDRDIEDLKALAEKRGMTLTGALQRAIRQSKYLDEVEAAGSLVLLEEPNKKIKRVTFK